MPDSESAQPARNHQIYDSEGKAFIIFFLVKVYQTRPRTINRMLKVILCWLALVS